MKIITVTETGYYDTRGERCRFIMAGEKLTVADEQPHAPCPSKQGQGVWTTCGAFIESENYKP